MDRRAKDTLFVLKCPLLHNGDPHRPLSRDFLLQKYVRYSCYIPQQHSIQGHDGEVGTEPGYLEVAS
eukprot:scaffold6157_cov87-Skeletonema_menzelii.AAC.1